MGLKFERAKGQVRLAFKYIDPQAPEREFSFGVKLDEGDNYQVMECSPPLQGLEPLLAQLKQHNDLPYFVQALRRRFRALFLPDADAAGIATVPAAGGSNPLVATGAGADARKSASAKDSQANSAV